MTAPHDLPPDLPPDLPAPAEGWQLFQAPAAAFLLHVGPSWHRLREGGHEYCFRVETRHGNHSGFLHGGMTAAFADHALGYTALQTLGGQPTATVQLTMTYLAPARPGEMVFCRAEIVRQTRSLIFLRADILVEDRVIATANGVWKRIERSS